ncbi:hypothetical protein KA005_85075 [bacterium]|nr:hypothetical protein [bacterium]
MKWRKLRIKKDELIKTLLAEEARGSTNASAYNDFDSRKAMYWTGYAACARQLLRLVEVWHWDISKKKRKRK